MVLLKHFRDSRRAWFLPFLLNCKFRILKIHTWPWSLWDAYINNPFLLFYPQASEPTMKLACYTVCLEFLYTVSREDGFGKMLNCSRNSLFFSVLVFRFKRKCQKINCWFCIRIYETFIAVLCRATDRQFVISSSLRHPCPVGNAGQRGSRVGVEENVT